MFLLQLHHPSHPTSRFRYAALARVVMSSDANAGRLDIAASVIDRMRTFTSLCNSVRAIATTEFLQLLQLRRLPPPFISHCIQRLDPTECGFINASAEPPPPSPATPPLPVYTSLQVVLVTFFVHAALSVPLQRE